MKDERRAKGAPGILAHQWEVCAHLYAFCMRIRGRVIVPLNAMPLGPKIVLWVVAVMVLMLLLLAGFCFTQPHRPAERGRPPGASQLSSSQAPAA
jgi:hypothetical protein